MRIKNYELEKKLPLNRFKEFFLQPIMWRFKKLFMCNFSHIDFFK